MEKPDRKSIPVAVGVMFVLFVIVPFLPHLFTGLTALYTWGLELVVVFGLFIVLGMSFDGCWFGLLVDARNKISMSRLQMSLWTGLFTSCLFVIYVWNLRHASPLSAGLEFTVPQSIWILMGMAGVATAASPLILSAKPDAKAPAAPAVPAAVPPPPPDSGKFVDGVVVKRDANVKPEWSDLVLGDDAGNGEAIDLTKVQQLLLSFVAVGAYGFLIAKEMYGNTGVIPPLPELSTGFLALIGAGHASYLAYKAVPHTN